MIRVRYRVLSSAEIRGVVCRRLMIWKLPRAIQYLKDNTPVPVLKLFMDDSCLTASRVVDMQEILKVVSEFMNWSRFKLKSSKSRALVYDKGKVVEWLVGDSIEEDELFKLTLNMVPKFYHHEERHYSIPTSSYFA